MHWSTNFEKPQPSKNHNMGCCRAHSFGQPAACAGEPVPARCPCHLNPCSLQRPLPAHSLCTGSHCNRQEIKCESGIPHRGCASSTPPCLAGHVVLLTDFNVPELPFCIVAYFPPKSGAQMDSAKSHHLVHNPSKMSSTRCCRCTAKAVQRQLHLACVRPPVIVLEF